MPAPDRLSGVLCPVLTPFDGNLNPDPERLVELCRWLLSQGVGLAPFGTTSEGNSLSVAEKTDLLDRLVAAGIDPGRLMPGTGCCSLSDTVALTRHAVGLGCAGVLMLPPFYYKGVSDAGLYASFAEVIERVGNSALRVYLYHIPPVAQVGLSVALVERLVRAYPDTVVGIKDSSRDWGNTQALLERGWDDFRVFVGSESLLLRNMEHGGAGCISATANIHPTAIQALFANWRDPGAPEAQAQLDALRRIVEDYPMIPALKAVIAAYTGQAGWEAVRPPLVALDDERKRALLATLRQHRFDMPGLAAWPEPVTTS
jgi:4-hydroxy-tetrahydrodipicolinate synthase